jgi:hypothetical protein
MGNGGLNHIKHNIRIRPAAVRQGNAFMFAQLVSRNHQIFMDVEVGGYGFGDELVKLVVVHQGINLPSLE